MLARRHGLLAARAQGVMDLRMRIGALQDAPGRVPNPMGHAFSQPDDTLPPLAPCASTAL